MRKTTVSGITPDNRLLVDIVGLQSMLSLGRVSCVQIATECGAVVPIGRRKMYSVDKIKNYISAMGEGRTEQGNTSDE